MTQLPISNQAQAEKELARRLLARRRLLYFTQQTQSNYEAGWVHSDICARLERFSRQVIEKKSPRLMLLMPPRHGKSTLASISFPAWHLGQAPKHEIINASYNLDLPMRFSRRVRDLFRDPTYHALFPDSILDPDSQSVEAWLTTVGGGFTAAGVGGGITGKGAHILIVDDPIKNQEEADNILVRDQLWDWYQSTAYTRLAPGGGVLLIETWWNDDDLAGRIQQLAQQDPLADQFEVVKYPALSEGIELRERETMNFRRIDCPEDMAVVHMKLAALPDRDKYEVLRLPGQALHEARYPSDALKRIRANMAKRIWSALYQQNPVPDEGAYFQKDQFKHSANPPALQGKHIFSAWDFAISQKQTADFTVGVTVVQDEHDVLHVLDMTRIKGDALDIVEAILDTYERWGKIEKTVYQVGFEDGQIWRSIEPLLRRRMHERGAFPSCELLKPFTDKLARGRPLQGRMQHGKVMFPVEAPWLQVCMQEMLRFPAGAHDDCVDALAWVAHLTMNRMPPSAPKPAALKSWKDRLDVFVEGLAGTHMSA